MPKIIHYRNKCIGCNSCVEHAPSFWNINKHDGKSDLHGAKNKNGVFVTEITMLDLEKNKKAAKDCPVRIIKVEE
ncbi:TPA: ferredoxin [Candidatus Woesearchaeota archaeon]|nr:ferredoxin [archaeon]HIJ11587.1 ferredoxin [Candidatus Woesearchaeota archaeon]|tara:strand:- start:158 stop:382 length:225 start_codon:yes stop_codon:yes gene_type:complete